MLFYTFDLLETFPKKKIGEGQNTKNIRNYLTVITYTHICIILQIVDDSEIKIAIFLTDVQHLTRTQKIVDDLLQD